MFSEMCTKCLKEVGRDVLNFDKELMVESSEEQNQDMEKLMDELFPGASPEMKVFLQCQRDGCTCRKKEALAS
jgi:hypothetical protein